MSDPGLPFQRRTATTPSRGYARSSFAVVILGVLGLAWLQFGRQNHGAQHLSTPEARAILETQPETVDHQKQALSRVWIQVLSDVRLLRKAQQSNIPELEEMAERMLGQVRAASEPR